MGKAKIICILLFGIFACTGTYSQCSSLRADVVDTYRAEIGVREEGGNNRGKKVEAYLAVCGLPGGYPWCAGFTAWVLRQLGLNIPRGACGSYNWFKGEQTYYIRGQRGKLNWQQGDVFGLYYRSLGRIGHIGFIDGQDGQYLITVEGNTNELGSREGQAVARKRRLKRAVYAAANWIE